MSMIDVIKSAHDAINQISEHLEGATIYLDAGCTESFQLLGAFPLLLDHGARAVCCLESMSSLDTVADWNGTTDPAKKVVIMTSSLLSDTHRYTLRCLSAHTNVQCCSIFTSISEIGHSTYPDSPLGPDAFREYELLLVQDYEELIHKCKPKLGHTEDISLTEELIAEDKGWTQFSEEDVGDTASSPSAKVFHDDNSKERAQKLVVVVQHFPMVLCPLSPKFFVLPSEGLVSHARLSTEHEDSLSPGLPPLSTGVASDAEDVVPGANLTAQFLYHLALKMDLKLEIFSFGDLSKTVGRMLTDMSSLYDVGRRKRSASLLLIDRTLDLLTPCCHGDSFFDRVFSALPRRKQSPGSAAKTPQAASKLVSSPIQRAPLNVRVPLDNVINKDSRADNFQLLEAIEAALCGWNSSSPDSKVKDLINLSSRILDNKSSFIEERLLDGCLMATEGFRGTPYLEAILDRRMKDGAVLVKKWLQETLRKENISVNVKGRPGSVTKLELEHMIIALVSRDSSLLRNKGIIQFGAAALAALDQVSCDKWDAFISAEKMLHVSAGDTSQSLAAQIGDLINKSILAGPLGGKSSQGLLSFKDALLLTVVGYILAGENFPTSGSTSPFSWQEEQLMKESIVDAIMENPGLADLKFVEGLTEELEAFRSKINSNKEEPAKELTIDDFDDDQWGNWGDEDVDADGNSNKEERLNDMQLKLELRDRVDNLFRFLYKLSGLKRRNLPLREGLFSSELGFGGDSLENKGLLYKLLVRAFGKYEIPGLEHHSSAVGRLFKSGFGRFGLGQAKPSLVDHNAILVFVIGGTNGLEVREAFEALSEVGRPDIELIVGGTTLLNPDDMLDLLLGNSSYF